MLTAKISSMRRQIFLIPFTIFTVSFFLAVLHFGINTFPDWGYALNYAYFLRNLSLNMLISVMLIKKESNCWGCTGSDRKIVNLISFPYNILKASNLRKTI